MLSGGEMPHHDSLIKKLMKSKQPDKKSLKLPHSCGTVIGSLVFCSVLDICFQYLHSRSSECLNHI